MLEKYLLHGMHGRRIPRWDCIFRVLILHLSKHIPVTDPSQRELPPSRDRISAGDPCRCSYSHFLPVMRCSIPFCITSTLLLDVERTFAWRGQGIRRQHFHPWRKSMQKGKVLESQKGRPEIDLQNLLLEARVAVSGYFYAVDFGNDPTLGQHRVCKDRRCTCPLGEACPAVQAVIYYLKGGGARAPDPAPGYFPIAPASCPICGAAAYYMANLSSKHRGAGWTCAAAGVSHYWQTQGSIPRK
jgi:hypothetical protein